MNNPPKSVIALSLVITCPQGVSIYSLPEKFHAEARAGTLEILLADGGPTDPSEVPDTCKHVFIAGANVFHLRRVAIAEARHDWIIVTEDHCRFRADWLTRLRETIHARQDADMIAGTVVNDSTTGAWSMANYLYTFYTHRRGVEKEPAHSNIAHAVVRKDAILPHELARDGGFEFQTLWRLAESERRAYCREAIVDHVIQSNFQYASSDHYHNARASWSLIRVVIPTFHWKYVIRNALLNQFAHPAAVMRSVAGTADHSLAIRMRLYWIGFLNAFGGLQGFFLGGGRSPWKVV